jgi:ectoine hydroxylase-related dioxygenase (phytanoyl-CoA dioxygenase family)
MTDLRARFQEDGVVFIEGALDARAVALMEEAFAWSLAHPGPAAKSVLAGAPGEFYQDHANPESFPAYRALLCDTCITDLVADVLASEHLWLMYEQIWLKDGEKRRTPWHQDLGYIPLEGDHVVTLWTNLDPVPKEDSLELIPGSHRGPLYNPTAFNANDVSASMFDDGLWPRLPDIENERSKWPIVSWAMQPGDVLIFHQAMLHGGAGTRGGRRRSLSLRFFGDHAYCAERPENGVAESDKLKRRDSGGDPMLEMAHAAPGTLFRHPGFQQLR